jgi:hypothetical protein
LRHTGARLEMGSLMGDELEWYPHYYGRMVERNRKFQNK